MNSSAVILILLKILALMLLVLLNASFVVAELAMVRIRDSQLAPLAAKGHRSAKTARHILAHIDTYIGVTQFGITLASLGLGVAVEPIFHDLLEPLFELVGITSETVRNHIALGVGFFVNCYLLIVAGELVPKAIAIRRTLPAMLWTARPLTWFYRLSYPFIWLLHRSSDLILVRLGIAADELHGIQSEEELRVVLASAQGSTDRRNLILNALDLRHRIAREVMRPRTEITVFDSNATIAECLAIAEKSRYSRFPICDGGDADRARGVIHIKDLYALRDKAHTAQELLPLARKLICVPETARLEKLMQRFLEKKLHFAFVVDEFGGTLGIVTLENVLEAVVGQIQDEYDSEATQFVRRSENIWDVSGALPLHDLEKITGNLPHDETVATVSGWVTQQLGGFPKSGDSFSAGDFELHVEEMEGPRVGKLKVTRLKAPEGGTTILRREPPAPE
jgi:CBS domain containing-hemolysin-like protein